MKIQARQLEGGDRSPCNSMAPHAPLGANDLKNLLLQVTRLLIPDGGDSASGAERLTSLIARLQGTPDIGVQAFLMRADHADVVAMLKAGENEPDRLDRLSRNMSDRQRKMCMEDVAFTFPTDQPAPRADVAVHRLTLLIRTLEGEGHLPVA